MTRTVSFLFHLSGAGFVLSALLWGWITHAQQALPYNPLQPALPLRVLSTLVVISTVLSILATLLSAASGLRALWRRPARS